ncbi:polysaccharide deacetylase family protein [Desulfuribacillus alkaliarsenatis]|uniref:NodB homology domain-containing protein n=1 Tax=Desulfuribacillus alkaliarsenatis TaxID=766136 RepID=A0A1E5G3Q7_9FIRM|nr:polysaccharide deacetylase family protein [Desulfuribacillus alkaliarsenatis]OEF97656.1 hypothetical protein BHF68_14520 [Desulfuribacillus alkaliarsenatis]
MSKLFQLILTIVTIVSLVFVSFAGYIIWSAFQADATETIGDMPVEEAADEVRFDDDAISDGIDSDTSDVNGTGTETDLDSATADDSLLTLLTAALAKPAFVVLTYHHIDPELENNPITVTPERFDEHISILQASEYEPVSYRELTRFLRIAEETRRLQSLDRRFTPAEDEWMRESIDFINKLPNAGYHITFDDGYQSFYQYVFPRLRDEGIPSTFFVIVRSSFKESHTAPDWINYPHVTWEELRIIQRHPLFEVQSHTYSLHSYEPGNGDPIPSMTGRVYRRDLGRVETQEEFETRIYQDMILSRSYLENRLRPHVVSGLSYPYGAYNDYVIEQSKRAGLQYLFTNQPGLVTYETSALQIPRVNAGAPEISATDLMNSIDDLFFRRSF